MIQGSIVALVTPMTEEGTIDWPALDKLLGLHIELGTGAIVAVGTTGESATLDFDEHEAVIKRVVDTVAGKIPVIAGTGANSTSEALYLTQKAKDLGADACLLVTPYYNKPTQEGLWLHFRKIAESVEIPQILYNVPGRTACDMSNETALRLAEIPNVIGIKDATGDLARGRELIARAPQHFAIYSGDDLTAIELMLSGARGNISVTANVAIRQMAQACQAALQGNAGHARTLQDAMMPLHRALFIESNPIPVKWALHEMGLIGRGIRLPLTPLSEGRRGELLAALRACELVGG
ncbi:MAG: 4-hydroxy-tetrahydrodipicolinate synthase [Hahellaceae bacterium]|nr:4-hydroxy-tetrahydrodipicolinate synthase [Hahellaceae bacterium]